MNRKTHAIAATVVFGGLLIASSASAQTTTTHTASTTCPPGCVSASECQHRTALSPAERARRAAAARRARDQRAEAKRGELERVARDAAERARTEQRRADAEAEQLRADQERAERDREYQAGLDRKRAERDRLAHEQQTASVPTTTVTHARGGGPHAFRPALTMGMEGGAGGFTEDAHNTSYVGPMWGARIGVAFTDWLALEGRYVGMWNHGYAPNVGDGVHLSTNGTYGALRLTAPLPFVQPYVFGGVGVYRTNPVGSPGAVQASSLTAHTYAAFPMGVGVSMPMGRHLSLGTEGTYHVLAGEHFSSTPELSTGNIWTASSVLTYSM